MGKEIKTKAYNSEAVMREVHGPNMGQLRIDAFKHELETAHEKHVARRSRETHVPIVNFYCDQDGRELFR